MDLSACNDKFATLVSYRAFLRHTDHTRWILAISSLSLLSIRSLVNSEALIDPAICTSCTWSIGSSKLSGVS